MLCVKYCSNMYSLQFVFFLSVCLWDSSVWKPRLIVFDAAWTSTAWLCYFSKEGAWQPPERWPCSLGCSLVQRAPVLWMLPPPPLACLL